MNPVADVLDRAADHLERVGWVQGTFFEGGPADISSPCCAHGALMAVVVAPDGRRAAYYALERQIGDNSVHSWNDAKGQTAENVIATLRAAARAERGRQEASSEH